MHAKIKTKVLRNVFSYIQTNWIFGLASFEYCAQDLLVKVVDYFPSHEGLT